MSLRARFLSTVATAPNEERSGGKPVQERQVVVGTVKRSNFRGAEIQLEDGRVGYVTAEETDYSKFQRLRSGHRRRSNRGDGPCLVEGMRREWLVLREGDERGPLLSAARLDSDLAWERVRQIQDICEEAYETIKVEIDSYNSKGIITSLEGLRAFVPYSHLDQSDWERQEDTNMKVFPSDKKGSEIEITILEVDQEAVKLVCSEEEAKRSKAMRDIVPGALLTGTVRRITEYGAFVGIDNTKCSGLLHVSNISRVHVESTEDVLRVGERIKAVVLEVEENATRISLSTAELESVEGEMVTDKANVFAHAEDLAEEFREELMAFEEELEESEGEQQEF